MDSAHGISEDGDNQLDFHKHHFNAKREQKDSILKQIQKIMVLLAWGAQTT